MLGKAIAFAENLEHEELIWQSKKLLAAIERVFPGGSSFLPDLLPWPSDDGSLGFEWIHKDFRIGFNIELDPSESGWHIVTSRKLGGIMVSGSIDWEHEIFSVSDLTT